MEDAFEKLKNGQQNTVDNLIKWLKDSKIVDGLKVTEEKARQLFASVADTSNVELAKFKEAISKLAEDQKQTAEQLTTTLATEGPKFLGSAMAAVSGAAESAAETAAKSLKDKFPKI